MPAGKRSRSSTTTISTTVTITTNEAGESVPEVKQEVSVSENDSETEA